MRLPFVKMQGVGNDFVLIDAREGIGLPYSDLAIRLCDRHFGIGADGLLVVDNCQGFDAKMQMFNPDGSEDMCGNGLRCVARFVREGRSEVEDLRIATLAGSRRVLFEGGTVKAEMGAPKFEPAAIPFLGQVERVVNYPLVVDGDTLAITSLSTGSTHTMVFVDEMPTEESFLRLSPQIENHPLFPERTSVMWTRVDARDHISIRIWERGAGETLGCGTGACAATIAAQVHGFVGSLATVRSPGGSLSVEWSETSESIWMTGPAETVFGGAIEI